MKKKEVLNLVRPLYQENIESDILRQEIELINGLIKLMKLDTKQGVFLECNCFIDYETIEVEVKINLCLNCGKPLIL